MVTRAAELHHYGLADAGFEIGLIEIANAEEAGRGTFDLPFLHRGILTFHLDSQIDVRVAPIDGRGVTQWRSRM